MTKSVFLVWGPPSKGPRSIVMARELGMPIAFLAESWEPGLRAALSKYPRQLLRTYRRLLRDRPSVVFVQSPPTLAVWAVALYSTFRGGRFVVDAHSDAFQRARWTRPGWLNRLIARRAAATLVTDPYWANMLMRWGANPIVIPDVPTDYPVEPEVPGGVSDERFTVAFVNTWADDEPLGAVLDAARQLPNIGFKVSGRKSGHEAVIGEAPPNVEFVGYLPDPAYYALLASASGVLCLTNRDHTMQRGACEALSLGRPIITSDWPLLRSYFSKGTLHVDNTAEGIRQAVLLLMGQHGTLVREVQALRDVRRAEWSERRTGLIRLIEETRA